jgi:CheY-like chemotaxis protein
MPASQSRRAQILVVDDDALAARVVGRVLRAEHDIVDVRSGRDAMSRLQAGEHYDLVLCDLMMPEMTGMELFDEVKRAGLDIANRMVFMTGGAVTTRAREFVAALPDRWLEKPFDAETLRSLVRDALRMTAPATERDS